MSTLVSKPCISSSMKKLSLVPFVMLALFTETQVDAASGPITGAQSPQEVKGLPNVSMGPKGTVDTFGEFLVWYASEQIDSTWASAIDLSLDNKDSFTAKGLSFDWDYGFRVGLGYTTEYDGWDTQAYWTWFRTHSSSHLPNTGADILPEFFGGYVTTSEDHLSGESAQIEWSLLYNMIDWELGRNFWVSKSLSLRPFIGLKGGWINQTIHSQWQYHTTTTSPPSDLSATEDLKNNFWGVGPSGGINTKWKLRNFGEHFPSFVGDFSAAMMWGTWKNTDDYSDTTSRETFVNMDNSSLTALMLRGFLGIGWDLDFNAGRSHFSAQLGFESQMWFNQLRLPTFQQLRLHGDLTLQGGTLNCRFDF